MKDSEALENAFLRLKAYEDTGLSPQDVREMSQNLDEYIRKNILMVDKIQAEFPEGMYCGTLKMGNRVYTVYLTGMEAVNLSPLSCLFLGYKETTSKRKFTLMEV